MTTDQEGSSYRDFLKPGEKLSRSIEDVCIQLEKEGWSVTTRLARGLRYACPETRCGKHNLWIDTVTLVEERLDFKLRRTCLTFN
ncbi:hypothetical protein [Isoptericola sp. NPDC057653]|uniref:hypothetical protein n=1 Tax=Isoptericola sp. NPDC057653 TaxID=3346195 RepID=UPI00367F6D2B